jgi:hypothetical protein
VEIPRIFELYNESTVYGTSARSRAMYVNARFFPEDQRADKCIKCDICLEKCPQHIEISDWMEKVHEFLTAKL